MITVLSSNSQSFAPDEKAPLTIQTLTAPVEVKKDPVNTTTTGIIFDRVIEDNKTKSAQVPIPTVLTSGKSEKMNTPTGRTDDRPGAVLIGPGATPINVTAPVTGSPVQSTTSGKSEKMNTATGRTDDRPGVEETVTNVINTVGDLVSGKGIVAPGTKEASSKAAQSTSSAPTKKDNTFTYLAIGAGIIVVCGLIYWYFKK